MDFAALPIRSTGGCCRRTRTISANSTGYCGCCRPAACSMARSAGEHRERGSAPLSVPRPAEPDRLVELTLVEPGCLRREQMSRDRHRIDLCLADGEPRVTHPHQTARIYSHACRSTRACVTNA